MKKSTLILLAGLTALSLAACGSSSEAETTAAAETEAVAEGAETEGASEEETEAAEAGETPVYTVITNATFPPFDTLDTETGDIVGFDMDLIAAIGEDQGFDVEFVDMAFESLIPAVQTGNGDIIAAGMWSGDPERQAQVDFSDNYYTSGSALLVKADNDAITSMDSLTPDMKVATQIATNYADDLQAMVDEGKLGEVVILDGFDTCVLQVQNGDVDAMMAGIPIVTAYMQKNPDSLKVISDEEAYEEYGFAVKKGNTELLDKINAGLANVKENGVYDELMVKWGLSVEE